MSSHPVRLCCSLGIALILISQSAGRVQTSVEERREINRDIRCTIQVQDPEWIPSAPAIVRGKIENLTDRHLEIHVQPILYLSSTTSGAKRDRYWAPVDLFRDGPLPID